MRMKKFLVSASVLICLSATAQAGERTMPSPYLHLAGWDQKSLEAQTQSAVFLRARIKKLEQENEQLRNSIEQLRRGQNEQKAMSYDIKIQSLVEENKRLAKLLSQQNTQSSNATYYANKIQELQRENANLKTQLASKPSQTQSVDVSSYLNEINKFKTENAALRQRIQNTGNSNAAITGLQAQIKALESQNSALVNDKASLQTQLNLAKTTQKSGAKDDSAQITKMQTLVQELQSENRNLGKSLAEATGKLLEQQDLASKSDSQAQNWQGKEQQYKQSIAQLQSQLSSAKKELADNEAALTIANNTAKAGAGEYGKELEQLQTQNKSLRETIRAQNEMLLSSDNAVKTAERLLQENKVLQNKLALTSKAQNENGKSAQDLFNLNNNLQAQIAEKDQRIQELEGLKETVKQLRMQNDQMLMSKTQSSSSSTELSALQEQYDSLNVALNAERDNIIAYRNKIREIEAEKQALNNELTKVQLKNQELKAQLQILGEKSAKIDEIKIESKVFAEQKPQTIESDLKYVETNYPPVESTLPLLDKNGNHIDYNQNSEIVNNAPAEDMVEDKIKTEDLLSQELIPLNEDQ